MTRRQKTLLIFSLLALIGFVIADLVVLNMKDDLLPSTPPPPKRARNYGPEPRPYSDYAFIIERNIFNSDGLVAEPVGGAGDGDFERVAKPSQLPIKLVATIVHGLPQYSIAAVRVEGAPGPKIFHVNEEIENLAVIKKITRGKLFFQNRRNNRIEFIEWNLDSPLFTSGELAASGGTDQGITRENGNRFSVERNELQKHLANLPTLLQQARAVPALGPGGRVEGFKVMEMQPGSIFEKLGIRPNDVIKSVNGQPIDSPAKAIELFNQLRDAPQVSLGIDRNGKMEQFSYNLN